MTEQSDIVARLPEIQEQVTALRETILANVIMFAETPSPTFGEEQRVRLLQDRLLEAGIEDCSVDEAGNSLGFLAGTDPVQTIAVVAHLDTNLSRKTDVTVELHAEEILGPGVGDNSLGVAVLATLPTILDRLGIQFKSNLVLVGATRSQGRGDLSGLRFFLDNSREPIHYGLCLEGLQLGRLNSVSLGMIRGEISCEVPEEYDWSRFGATSAILIMNEIINKIMAIPMPRRPRTSIILGAIKGGTSFDTLATQASLRFEVRSESSDQVKQIEQHLHDIANEIRTETRAEVNFERVAGREPGGLKFGHPLVRGAREILEALDLEPRVGPSLSELSAFIVKEVPALTIGISTGRHTDLEDEVVDIAPITTGITQLLGILLTMDAEVDHES